MSGQTDTRYERLTAAIREGGEAARRAMDELVRAEQAHLARTLWQSYPKLRDAVQDLVIETFETIWRRAAKCGCFRPDGTYAEFRALAKKQASFLAKSRMRREAERKAKAEMLSVDALAGSEGARAFEPIDQRSYETDIVGVIEAERVLARVERVLPLLTERQRAIARLLMTVPAADVNEAICRRLHISEGAAREAKRALRQRLRDLVGF